MSVFQIGAKNYATCEVEGVMYDVHFHYYGMGSYVIEAVYHLHDHDRRSNLLKYMDEVWLSFAVDELDRIREEM